MKHTNTNQWNFAIARVQRAHLYKEVAHNSRIFLRDILFVSTGALTIVAGII